MKTRRRNSPGFALIELLFVLVIVAVLAFVFVRENFGGNTAAPQDGSQPPSAAQGENDVQAARAVRAQVNVQSSAQQKAVDQAAQ